jgi:hypothetical protein
LQLLPQNIVPLRFFHPLLDLTSNFQDSLLPIEEIVNPLQLFQNILSIQNLQAYTLKASTLKSGRNFEEFVKASKNTGDGIQYLKLLHKFLILLVYALLLRTMFVQILRKAIDG